MGVAKTSGLRLGLQIVPTMSSGEIVETIRVAEALGYEYFMLADEGLRGTI